MKSFPEMLASSSVSTPDMLASASNSIPLDKDNEKISDTVQHFAPATFDSIALLVIPPPVCFLFGVFSWWLTRGSIGNVSRECNAGGAWCRIVVRRWQLSAAIRLQRFVRRLDDAMYCDICEMLLNGRRQFREHCDGKKHRKIS